MHKFSTSIFFHDDVMLQMAWNHGVSLLHDLIPRLISLSAKGACEVTFDNVKCLFIFRNELSNLCFSCMLF